jgi:hypothetical protein
MGGVGNVLAHLHPCLLASDWRSRDMSSIVGDQFSLMIVCAVM